MLSYQNAFGLDIGDTALKLVWLDSKKYIKSYNKLSLDQGLVEDGVIKDKNALVEAIRKLIDTAVGEKIKINQVVACLPEPKTFIKVIEFSSVIPEKQIKKSILDGIDYYLPFKEEEVYIDWQRLPADSASDLTKVLVGAVTQKIADDYFDLLASANLKIQGFQIEAASIVNALIPEPRQKKAAGRAAQIVIDLGANRSSLILFDEGAIQFSVNMSVAGSEITGEISSKLKISFSEAEKKKMEYGFKDSTAPIYKILENSFFPVVKEINDVLKFYKQLGKGSVERGLLCGGGALTLKLDEYLNSKTGLRMAPGNSFANIRDEKYQKIKLPNHGIGFVSAIGLALEGLEVG